MKPCLRELGEEGGGGWKSVLSCVPLDDFGSSYY